MIFRSRRHRIVISKDFYMDWAIFIRLEHSEMEIWYYGSWKRSLNWSELLFRTLDISPKLLIISWYLKYIIYHLSAYSSSMISLNIVLWLIKYYFPLVFKISIPVSIVVIQITSFHPSSNISIIFPFLISSMRREWSSWWYRYIYTSILFLSNWVW